jgi:hypothetical protein
MVSYENDDDIKNAVIGRYDKFAESGGKTSDE